MRVCIPVEKNEGAESKPYNHFGSAPKFLIVNLEGEEIEVIDNGDLGHEHGNCQPIKALANKPVDVVIVRGIGAGAISKLNSMGTRVFQGVEGNVGEIRGCSGPVREVAEAWLRHELTDNLISCDHHDCGHH